MKKTYLMGSLLVAGIALSSCQQKNAQSSAKLSTEIDSVSYALGLLNGSGMSEGLNNMPGKPKFNVDAVVAGLSDGYKNDTAHYKLKPEDAQVFLQKYFDKQKRELEAKAMLLQDSIIREYKGKEGYTQTESGLIYRIITEGTGEKPKKTDNVRVKYTGKLHDGKVFDATDERNGGKPIDFPVGAVIQGWTEALQMMPVGSKWELIIPSQLAYGPRPMGDIPPYSVLFFDIELVDIVADNAK